MQLFLQEFDMLNIPKLDLTEPSDVILEKIVYNARYLVRIHRNVLHQLQDLKINDSSIKIKKTELLVKVNLYLLV